MRLLRYSSFRLIQPSNTPIQRRSYCDPHLIWHDCYRHWYGDGEEDVGHGNGEEGGGGEGECCAGEIVGAVEEVGPGECGSD